MDIERVTGVIRPRSPWEAVDFGLALARGWWRPVWAVWLAAVTPVWAAVYAGITLWVGPWVALLVLWWVRPLFSRLPLHVLSRALFGEVVSARGALGATPRLWRRHALRDMTIERLDFTRSFTQPVGQLEGLRGGERRQRLAVLHRDRHGVAWLLGGICLLMELCLLLAALALLAMATPEGFGVDWWAHFRSLFLGEPAGWYLAVFGACAFLATTLIEPFYVGGGFGLYLDRRTHLEGWDVELAFRRLARRIGSGERGGGERSGEGRSGAGRAAALVAALAGTILAAGAVSAAEAPQAAERDPAAVAQEVLAHPDFDTRETVERWRFRYPLDGRAPERRSSISFAGLAQLLEVLLWVLAAALLVLLAVWVVGQAQRGSRRRRGVGAPPPAVLFGLDLAPESLPDDVPAAARELFAAGRATEALGLLYRGALARLARRRQVAASWTEEECVRHLAGQLDEGGAAWFRRLAVAWQAAAYAHRVPAPPAFEGLCGDWRRHLDAAPEGAS